MSSIRSDRALTRSSTCTPARAAGGARLQRQRHGPPVAGRGAARRGAGDRRRGGWLRARGRRRVHAQHRAVRGQRHLRDPHRPRRDGPGDGDGLHPAPAELGHAELHHVERERQGLSTSPRRRTGPMSSTRCRRRSTPSFTCTTATAAAGRELACNDNTNGVTSRVTVPLAAGQVITIIGDSRPSSSGTLTLHIAAL